MNLREALQDIYDRRGELTPAIVVEEAADPDHPLHTRLEWDDAVAGEAYRKHQAAQLIRSVKVVYAESPDGEKRSARAFLPVRPEDEPERSRYVPTEVALADPFLRKIVLREAEREWKSLRRKYGHLEEFAQIVAGDLGEMAS